jgi:hypothetical protein
MQKTGEAYTAARAHITRKRTTRVAKAAKPAVDYAKIAGMSDAVIKEKTGCTWERWVKELDKHNASELSHGEITKIVKFFKVPDWWTQMVTVGYERIKGLRARGQRRDGSYEVNKSRTFNVPVAELFDACADSATRKRWLDGASVKVTTATRPRSMRIKWSEGGTLALWFTSKGPGKSAMGVQHTKLPDAATATRLRGFWSERLGALSGVLGEGSPRA